MRNTSGAVSRGDAAPPDLTPEEFEKIRRLAHHRFGLDLRKGKELLVAARLGKKIRELGLRSFSEYHRYVLEDPTGAALSGMIDALATNHTAFNREPEHFEYLTTQLLPLLAHRERIDVWSAACATGEEPYSIATALIEGLDGASRPQIQILATDISSRALSVAERAIYPADRLKDAPKPWVRRFLLRGEGQWTGWYRMKPEVRDLVRFRRLNLVEPFPSDFRFDVIFCRNVMIYFDKPTQQSLVNRLAQCLCPGGHLFVGHAESLAGLAQPLRYIRPAVYQRIGGHLPVVEQAARVG